MSDVFEVRERDTDKIVKTVPVTDADSHNGQKTLRDLVRDIDTTTYYVTISNGEPTQTEKHATD